MKKLVFISFLVLTAQFALYAQKGLSDEGYKHWVKAVALMENVKVESDYFLVLEEFRKVTETDSMYADTYYNMGILWTKMGELGGGVPCFDAAKRWYEKYLTLRPAEKKAFTEELTKLEVKREIFMQGILDNMSLINAGTPREIKIKFGTPMCKNGVYVDAFYIKQNLFTVADYKRLITPMAIALTSSLKRKTFNLPYQQNSTGNDNVPYILSAITAEQIIEILNCITSKNFFILTWDHYQMMAYSKISPYLGNNRKGELTLKGKDWFKCTQTKTLYSDGSAVKGVFDIPKIAEWIFFADKHEYNVANGGYYTISIPKNYEMSNGYSDFGFRLALPASEK